MGKNKFTWEPLTEKDFDDLKAYASNAVTEERIVIKRRVVRSLVTNMLLAGCKVPGIRLINKHGKAESELFPDLKK